MSSNRTLDATIHAHQFATTRNLPVYRIDVHGGSDTSRDYNPDTGQWDLPSLPSVTIALHDGPEFMAWFTAVGVAEVELGRREVDTTVNAWARHDGIRWSFWGSLNRPESWARTPVRPTWGADGPRNEAHVSLADFAALVPVLSRSVAVAR